MGTPDDIVINFGTIYHVLDWEPMLIESEGATVHPLPSRPGFAWWPAAWI